MRLEATAPVRDIDVRATPSRVELASTGPHSANRSSADDNSESRLTNSTATSPIDPPELVVTGLAH